MLLLILVVFRVHLVFRVRLVYKSAFFHNYKVSAYLTDLFSSSFCFVLELLKCFSANWVVRLRFEACVAAVVKATVEFLCCFCAWIVAIY